MLYAEITNTNGDDNVVAGLVERNGNFWVENLPLASGTNWLTVTATDAAGNVSQTNISVVQSLVNMTFTSIPEVSNQVVVTVQGTIDTFGYTVWVNGVQAWPSGAAPIAWEADNVPVNGTGTAVFEALAIPNSDHGGNGTPGTGGGGTNSTLANPGNPVPSMPGSVRLAFDEDFKPAIICTNYTATIIQCSWTNYATNAGVVTTNIWIANFTEHWGLGSPGESLWSAWQNYNNPNNSVGGGFYNPLPSGSGFTAFYQNWNQFGNGVSIGYTSANNNDFSSPSGTNSSTMDMSGSVGSQAPSFGSLGPTYDPGPWAFGSAEESSYTNSTPGLNAFAYYCGIPYSVSQSPSIYTIQRKVASSYFLRTGGKAASPRQAVFQLAVTAATASNRWSPTPTPVGVPYTQITVMGQPLGNDNNLFVSEPDGIMVPIPVDVPGSPSFTYNVTPTKYEMVIQVTTNGTTVPLDPDTATTFCVGQNLQFQFTNVPVTPNAPTLSILPASYANWALPPKYVNQSWQVSFLSGGYGYGGGQRTYTYYGSVNYTNNSSLLRGRLTNQCWYVNGPGGLATVRGELYFANGTRVSVGASGTISIYRPRAWLKPHDPNDVDPFYTITPALLRFCTLKLGENDQSGIGTMIFGININSQFSGAFGLTQLITGDYSNPMYDFSTERCDGSEFYEGPKTLKGRQDPTFVCQDLHFTDGPSCFWGTPNVVNLSARDFLRFKPDGGIWVTVAIWTWETVGCAEENMLYQWRRSIDLTTGPNSSIIGSDELPMWTSNQGGMSSKD
jgi:hypothetical protein